VCPNVSNQTQFRIVGHSHVVVNTAGDLRYIKQMAAQYTTEVFPIKMAAYEVFKALSPADKKAAKKVTKPTKTANAMAHWLCLLRGYKPTKTSGNILHHQVRRRLDICPVPLSLPVQLS
jgi:hypothetical protein